MRQVALVAASRFHRLETGVVGGSVTIWNHGTRSVAREVPPNRPRRRDEVSVHPLEATCAVTSGSACLLNCTRRRPSGWAATINSPASSGALSRGRQTAATSSTRHPGSRRLIGGNSGPAQPLRRASSAGHPHAHRRRQRTLPRRPFTGSLRRIWRRRKSTA